MGPSEERARVGGRYHVDLNVARTRRKVISANRSAAGNEGICVNALNTRIPVRDRLVQGERVRDRSVQGEGVSKGLSLFKLPPKNDVAGSTTFTGYGVSDDIGSDARRSKHHKRHTHCAAGQPHRRPDVRTMAG